MTYDQNNGHYEPYHYLLMLRSSIVFFLIPEVHGSVSCSRILPIVNADGTTACHVSKFPLFRGMRYCALWYMVWYRTAVPTMRYGMRYCFVPHLSTAGFHLAIPYHGFFWALIILIPGITVASDVHVSTVLDKTVVAAFDQGRARKRSNIVPIQV